MKFLILLSALAIAFCVNGYTVREDSGDKAMFLRIIECAQKAVINGIEEIGLPSHDPLRISHNFSQEIPIGDYNIAIAMENMVMEGIPWWNVTQMDDVTEELGTDIFDYTIYWKMMSFEGNWRLAVVNTETKEQLLNDEGTFGFELDHLTFAGRFNFSKPTDEKDGSFNDFIIHLHTEESEFHIDGLGIVSDIIAAIGGPGLREFVNLDLFSTVLGPGLRDKFNVDWVGKPERILALISYCNN